MTLDAKSVHILNKNEPNKIIYPSVKNAFHYIELKDGVVTEHFIDLDRPKNSYQLVIPEMTSESFRFHKKLSDDDYQALDNDESEYYRQTTYIQDLESSETVCSPSCEDEVFSAFEKKPLKKSSPRNMKNAMKILDELLTPKQKRRYLENV